MARAGRYGGGGCPVIGGLAPVGRLGADPSVPAPDQTAAPATGPGSPAGGVQQAGGYRRPAPVRAAPASRIVAGVPAVAPVLAEEAAKIAATAIPTTMEHPAGASPAPAVLGALPVYLSWASSLGAPGPVRWWLPRRAIGPGRPRSGPPDMTVPAQMPVPLGGWPPPRTRSPQRRPTRPLTATALSGASLAALTPTVVEVPAVAEVPAVEVPAVVEIPAVLAPSPVSYPERPNESAGAAGPLASYQRGRPWLAVTTALSDDEPAALRRALGNRYDACLRQVTRVLAAQPALRAAAGPQVASLVAVLAYWSAERLRVNTALRSPDPDPETAEAVSVLARSAMLGLRRLPTVLGPVYRTASLPEAALGAYRPGTLLVEPAFVDVATVRSAPLQASVEYLIWSTTARRTDRLAGRTVGAGPTALFAAGTSYVVLAVDQPAAGRPTRVLLRELAGAGRIVAAAERERGPARDVRAAVATATLTADAKALQRLRTVADGELIGAQHTEEWPAGADFPLGLAGDGSLFLPMDTTQERAEP